MASPTFVLVALMLLSCSQLPGVAAFSLSISPDHIRLPTRSSSSVTVSCKANVSITGCQFTWISKDGEVGPILELRRGKHSLANPTHLSKDLKGYSYSGQGLANGDCGVTLRIENFKIWMVGCRVQSHGGSWNYAWMDLYADAWRNPPNTVTWREAVVVPGRNASLAVKSTDPLTVCHFWLPGCPSMVALDQGAASPNLAARHTYLGTGLQDGECGLTLVNVTEEDNGPVVCNIRKVLPNADDYRFIALIVASPPSATVFNVIQNGTDVTATCMVGKSRPVANITWFLGDDVIRQDSYDDSPGDSKDEWRWPWMRGSVEQKVSLQLQPKDNGKVLECVVSHVALAQPFEAYRKVLYTTKSNTEAQAQEVAVMAMEMAKVNLEAAKSSARAEEARAKNEEARTREEEAWATNAEEELQFERHRRNQSLQQSKEAQSSQG